MADCRSAVRTVTEHLTALHGLPFPKARGGVNVQLCGSVWGFEFCFALALSVG